MLKCQAFFEVKKMNGVKAPFHVCLHGRTGVEGYRFWVEVFHMEGQETSIVFPLRNRKDEAKMDARNYLTRKGVDYKEVPITFELDF